MVVEADGAAIGAVVDAVVEVLRIAADAVTPAPPVVRGLAAEYVQGVLALPSSRTVVLLHAGRLLTSKERIALTKTGAEKTHG